MRWRPSTSWRRLADVRPEEASAVLWAMLYVITLFLAYYVLRPIRDELGVASGIDNLSWLFAGTLLAMLVATPLFALAVRSLTRRQFIALSYRFFGANLVMFAGLLQFAPSEWQIWIGRTFFIWVSVFNLFVVSVFWSLMVDLFDSQQSKRLFGLLAAGATIGGILGSAITTSLVAHLDRIWLMAIATVFLELAVLASRRLTRIAPTLQPEDLQKKPEQPIGGGILSGMVHTLRSPYLGGLALFILLYSVTSTFLYFQQANIAQASFPDNKARIAFFANIDLVVNVITLFLQVFLTGRFIQRFGIVATLCVLPLVSLMGFVALAASSSVIVVVVAQVARRVANFALARPAREILFTSSDRQDRYKAKNFIDTVVYRGGDQVASWGYTGLAGLGLTLGQIPLIAVPLSVAWLGLCVWLGKTHQAQQKKSTIRLASD
ncbi:MFS transporter [Pseudomonas putida]|uniref:MFS transporter n=2 Tax=Pseudomonas putida TaxID=303 RepID=A0ABD7BFN5_PSEPU|nr:MFS transporter [Pseudomonas putida]QOC98664.1 MFS transporter [Pseudomonas putida]